MACNGYKLPGIHGYIPHFQTKPQMMCTTLPWPMRYLPMAEPTAFADMELEAFLSHPASHPAGAKNDPMIQAVDMFLYPLSHLDHGYHGKICSRASIWK